MKNPHYEYHTMAAKSRIKARETERKVDKTAAAAQEVDELF